MLFQVNRVYILKFLCIRMFLMKNFKLLSLSLLIFSGLTYAQANQTQSVATHRNNATIFGSLALSITGFAGAAYSGFKGLYCMGQISSLKEKFARNREGRPYFIYPAETIAKLEEQKSKEFRRFGISSLMAAVGSLSFYTAVCNYQPRSTTAHLNKHINNTNR